MNDFRIFSDSAFQDSLEESLTRTLQKERNINGESEDRKDDQLSPRDIKDIDAKMEIDESSLVNGNTQISGLMPPISHLLGKGATSHHPEASANDTSPDAKQEPPLSIPQISLSASPQTRQPTSALSSLSPVDVSSRSSPIPAASAIPAIPTTTRVPDNASIAEPVEAGSTVSIDRMVETDSQSGSGSTHPIREDSDITMVGTESV